MKLSFDELPQAVSDLFDKLTNIERLLLSEKNEKGSEEDQLLTIKETAKLLKVAVPTVYAYVSRCEIPHCKLKKRLYFSRKELTEWVKSGRKQTISEITASTQNMLKKKK